MAVATGMDAQIGLADETTYGTFQTPTQFYEFLPPESLKRNAERVESKAYTPGTMLLPANRWQEGRVGVEGDAQFELLDRGSAFLFKHALGKITTTQPDAAGSPTVFEHLCELAPLDGLSATIQVGRPQADGTVAPFDYVGCKVASWELSNEVDGVPILKLTFDGQDELPEGANPLAPADFDATAELLTWAGATIELAGSQFDVRSISFSGTNALKTDRYFLSGSGSRLKKEPKDNAGGRRNIEGTMAADFESRVPYNRFVNGETASIVSRWEAATIEGTYLYTIEATAGTVRFEGETPNASDDDMLEQSLPFKVLGGASGEFSVLVRDTNPTP